MKTFKTIAVVASLCASGIVAAAVPGQTEATKATSNEANFIITADKSIDIVLEGSGQRLKQQLHSGHWLEQAYKFSATGYNLEGPLLVRAAQGYYDNAGKWTPTRNGEVQTNMHLSFPPASTQVCVNPENGTNTTYKTYRVSEGATVDGIYCDAGFNLKNVNLSSYFSSTKDINGTYSIVLEAVEFL